LVICFTPNKIPGQEKLFRNKEGDPIRIYAFFDSYVEFYHYTKKFAAKERCFYEIIFGELPQKPHFDIDINNNDIELENIDAIGDLLVESVITACNEILSENNVTFDIHRDVLIYSSHGNEKRSYHIVINNKYHDGNKEAKAFYEAVIKKVNLLTNDKYASLLSKFIDNGVYSSRQQFRIYGCQKLLTNRPKIFLETFKYKGEIITHVYPEEDIADPVVKHLTILYESLVSYVSGSKYVPSLVPPTPFRHSDLSSQPDLEDETVNRCMNMLNIKLPGGAPFKINSITGHLILLKRTAPSYCPVCHKQYLQGQPNSKTKPHEAENPFMFIVGGKIYWNCRRSDESYFLGYLAITIQELLANDRELVDDAPDMSGEFCFGDFDIGTPTLQITRDNVNNETFEPCPGISSQEVNTTLSICSQNSPFSIPEPEQRQQDVLKTTSQLLKNVNNKNNDHRPDLGCKLTGSENYTNEKKSRGKPKYFCLALSQTDWNTNVTS
jgi:hypothetical protein